MNNTKTAIINNFNKAAITYEQHAHVQKQAAYQLLSNIENIHPKLILELGCGTGFLTKLIKEKFSSSNYIISDIADNMLKLCKSNNYSSKSLFCIADGESLPISNQLDLIISNLTFQWFQNLQSSLAFLSKHTEVLAFSTLTKNTFREWKQKHQELNIQYHILDMISLEELNNLCKKYCKSEYHIQTQTINLHFNNASDFIKNLRYTGAITSTNHYVPSCLKKLIKVFAKGININYDIAYCVLK